MNRLAESFSLPGVLLAAFQEIGVELEKILNIGHGNQEIASNIPYQILNAALFLPFAWIAIVCLEQEVGPEGNP